MSRPHRRGNNIKHEGLRARTYKLKNRVRVNCTSGTVAEVQANKCPHGARV